MKKFSELDPAGKDFVTRRVNERWGQLYHLEKEWGERAFNYLFLTNAGGAIATLSFLGASEVVMRILAAKVALVFFVFGVVFVGVATAKQFHHMSDLFGKWKSESDDVFGDKLTLNELHSRDNHRAVTGFFDYAIPYASFACFLAGCVSGGIALLN